VGVGDTLVLFPPPVGHLVELVVAEGVGDLDDPAGLSAVDEEVLRVLAA
jgi:hypothetical protein